MSQRPEFIAVTEAEDRRAFCSAYAAWSRMVYERVGIVLGTVLTCGGAGDEVIAEFLSTIDRERRIGNGHAVDAMSRRHGLPPGLTRECGLDIVWTLTAPEVADRLIRRCGWTLAAYERWLFAALAASLL